jgi:hypothetical protein
MRLVASSVAPDDCPSLRISGDRTGYRLLDRGRMTELMKAQAADGPSAA